MATVYHRDQAGAPALVYSTAEGGVNQFTALKTVLKACLIEGYNAQPSAGWLLINEGANFIVLRPGSQSGYVCLTWAAGGTVRVYLAETYTGMSGDVMTGDGLKTGNADGLTKPQTIATYRLAYSSTATSWVMVADTKTFVLTMAGNNSNSELDSPLYAGLTLYVGEDSAGAMIAVGGEATTAVSFGSAYSFFSSSNGFTVLKRPSSGLLVGSGSIDVLAPSLRRNVTTNSFGGVLKLQNAQLSMIPWAGDFVLSGTLRGVAGVPDLAYAASVSQAAKCLGRSTPMKFRDINNPIDLGDGHAYFAGVAHQASFFVLTDNPAFW